jgi:3'-phosphoadenosine 5'-phosphosulfate sulfotransferase (PAPS reductase)/FAD synthetase
MTYKGLMIAVSGGRSSAMMARHIQISEKYKDLEKLYVFANTGMERPETIEFLQKRNIKEAFRILLHYYDKLYQKALDQRENLNEKLHLIESNKVDSNINAQLIINNL